MISTLAYSDARSGAHPTHSVSPLETTWQSLDMVETDALDVHRLHTRMGWKLFLLPTVIYIAHSSTMGQYRTLLRSSPPLFYDPWTLDEKVDMQCRYPDWIVGRMSILLVGRARPSALPLFSTP